MTADGPLCTNGAAAGPHNFDAHSLGALLELDSTQAADLCRGLREIPFVQALNEESYTLHETVRNLLLDNLWQERREQCRAWSQRAAEYFQAQEDEPSRLEALYHWLVADPDRAAHLVWAWGAGWNNAFQYEWVEALVQLGLEHDVANRLTRRARGWIYYWKARTHSRYSENRDALTSLTAALEAAHGDRQLEANCIQALGDVHMGLAEHAAARERYEEALPHRWRHLSRIPRSMEVSLNQAVPIHGSGLLSPSLTQ